MTSTENMKQLHEDIEQDEAEEEEPFICEECSTELNDFDYGSYESYCEECYTKIFHPQIWSEQQRKREWEEHLQKDDSDSESEDNSDIDE